MRDRVVGVNGDLARHPLLDEIRVARYKPHQDLAEPVVVAMDRLQGRHLEGPGPGHAVAVAGHEHDRDSKALAQEARRVDAVEVARECHVDHRELGLRAGSQAHRIERRSTLRWTGERVEARLERGERRGGYAGE